MSDDGGGVKALRDALRTCLQIAGGLTEATRQRAVAAARELLDQADAGLGTVGRKVSGRIPPQVHSLADELVSAGRANRDLLVSLIREEVEKAAERIGRELGRVGELIDLLDRRVRDLEGSVFKAPEPDGAKAAGGAAGAPRPSRAPEAAAGGPVEQTAAEPAGPVRGEDLTAETAPSARKTAARKTTARKPAAATGADSPAKQAAAKKAATKKAVTTKSSAAKAAAAGKKTAASKKTAAKAAAAKKTTARKTAAKKAAAESAAEKTAAGKGTAAKKTAAKKEAAGKTPEAAPKDADE